ncbi:NAD(P)/FAD-dependent oxidoreductase [Rhodovastum atsumiense]|uniref:NAD(P)/FAD-dependent oxidoreductase n=1 Tax=Rhodovastum atsumiense TaxID=504468 RepID=A0A5M6IRR9_9PROT|nr:NAD(P)/FAD-dependent oxidoreductase [Rhodovastum atsumiense]KAA5610976.1 NAD(P)/FAD-dependent oxidoreductase [Rhodovastum atsumiense]CAH2600246.1 NAD(P)/FAD-dependent oxidoreductase [Rhodovastum atsumiense]
MVEERFDAVVIGSGLGGLTAAALVARAGRRVLVLERNPGIGGAATVYRHGALTIEASLHALDGLDPQDPKTPLFAALGLDHGLDYVEPAELYEVRGGPVGAPFTLPAGPEAALSACIARFPRHENALRRYIDAVLAVRSGATVLTAHMDEPGWWLRHLPEAATRLWPLIRHARATVGDVLRGLFGADEAVKCALAAALPYYHDDPERMLFLAYAVAQGSFLAGGGHYLRGGSRTLSAQLAARVEEAGGRIETDREAFHLVVDRQRIAGVAHRRRGGNDVRKALAPVVFGNAAPAVLAGMLPEAWQGPFAAPYARRPISVSLWTVALGLSEPAARFGLRAYETILLPSWMTTLADYRQATAVLADPDGDRLPPMILADYGRIDSGLNEGPPHLVTLCGMDRLANWDGLDEATARRRRESWMDRLVAALDAEFPGLARAVTQREMATATTMQAYLNTPGGAVYGFAPETLLRSPATAVPGLYLASAWAAGGGYTGAMLGGAMAARLALRGG